MYANSVLALTGALLSAVAAVPFAGEPHHHRHPHKREIVWETVYDDVVVTVPVTKTVWVEAGEETPAAESTSDVQPAAYTPPASSSAPAAPAYTPPASSSAPAAPAYTPPTSSAAAAPAYTPPTTSSVYVAPTPATTYQAPSTPEAPTTSAAPAPVSSSAPATGGGSSDLSGAASPGNTHSGDLTYYAPGLGACGWTNTTEQPIIAVAEKLFDSFSNGNPNNNPLCGLWITITGKDGNKHKGQVVDRCPGCAEFDLDLSQTLFNDATSNGDGRVSGMQWCFD